MSLDLKAGFLPYADGSGYEVNVRLRLDPDLDTHVMSIECGYQFEVKDWPALRDGIERLLRVLPDTTSDKAGERSDA